MTGDIRDFLPPPPWKGPPIPGGLRSPRLIGPTERRKVPEEIKYFPDTPEQCCTSVDRTALRPQLDAAFMEAISRAKDRR